MNYYEAALATLVSKFHLHGNI